MGKQQPSKCISVEKAKALHEYWCNTRAKELQKCLGQVDAHEFWWDLGELKEYIEYVQECSSNQGILKPGIRFYLGAYAGDDAKGEGKIPGATLFMAPTGGPVRSTGKDDITIENNYRIAPMNGAGSGNPPSKY